MGVAGAGAEGEVKAGRGVASRAGGGGSLGQERDRRRKSQEQEKNRRRENQDLGLDLEGRGDPRIKGPNQETGGSQDLQRERKRSRGELASVMWRARLLKMPKISSMTMNLQNALMIS